MPAWLSLFSACNTGNADWYIDSGASAHMTMNEDWLNSKNPTSAIQEIVVVNNDRLPVKATGKLPLQVAKNNKTETIEIHDALLIPGISVNLLSMSKIVEKGNKVIFDGRGCRVIDGNDNLVATATLTNHTYHLDQPKLTKSIEPNLNLSTTLMTAAYGIAD